MARLIIKQPQQQNVCEITSSQFANFNYHRFNIYYFIIMMNLEPFRLSHKEEKSQKEVFQKDQRRECSMKERYFP
ncbi:hypothetical protein pb186bvf_012013 [Paramecium bursaria]